MDYFNALADKIKSLRNSSISIDLFRDWVSDSGNEIEKYFSRGQLLKLRHADLAVVLDLSKKVLPACKRCSSIFNEGVFIDKVTHVVCVDSVIGAVGLGILEKIDRPSWYKIAEPHVGAAAYYKCNSCGSLWSIVEPERQYRGGWQRIA